jgi:hypothetical protein
MATINDEAIATHGQEIQREVVERVGVTELNRYYDGHVVGR